MATTTTTSSSTTTSTTTSSTVTTTVTTMPPINQKYWDVYIGGIEVTDYLRKAKKIETYGDSITICEMEFAKNISSVVTLSNALTCVIYLSSPGETPLRIFDGFLDLFQPEGAIVKVTAKDQLALLVNKQVMHYYDSSVVGDPAYPDGKISDIFIDLVMTYGGLSAGPGTTVTDSGLTTIITKFPCRNADIFERCRKLAETLNWVFYYKSSNGYVYFEPKNNTISGTTLTVGTNIIELPKWEYDRSEMINDLRLEGAQQLVQANQVFNGDASETSFVLTSIPEDIAVFYGDTKNYNTTAKIAAEVKVGDILDSTSVHDYEIDKKNKTIVFTSFVPSNNTGNILVEMSYVAPIPIHMANDASKQIYGTYAKTITLTDVVSFQDAWNRANNILAKYSVPFKSAKLKVLWNNHLFLTVGQSIRVVDSINTPNVDQYFTIYKITDYYPEAYIEIEVGDKQYTIEEYQANIVERVKRLEEGLIGSTNDFSEIVTSTATLDCVVKDTVVLVENINDSFILGHVANSLLGVTPLGDRSTELTSTTYTW